MLKALPLSNRLVVYLCNEDSVKIAVVLTHILQRRERESGVADRDWNQFCEATLSVAVRFEKCTLAVLLQVLAGWRLQSFLILSLRRQISALFLVTSQALTLIDNSR